MGVRAFQENFDSEKEAQDFLDKKYPKKEYTSQALINTKIAKLKEVARKYPRSLITSKVVPINPNMVDNSEIQYSKVGSKQVDTGKFGNTLQNIYHLGYTPTKPTQEQIENKQKECE